MKIILKEYEYTQCDECGQECDMLILLGQEPDYESSTAGICKNCLDRAVKCLEYSIKLKSSHGVLK